MQNTKKNIWDNLVNTMTPKQYFKAHNIRKTLSYDDAFESVLATTKSKKLIKLAMSGLAAPITVLTMDQLKQDWEVEC